MCFILCHSWTFSWLFLILGILCWMLCVLFLFHFWHFSGRLRLPSWTWELSVSIRLPGLSAGQLPNLWIGVTKTLPLGCAPYRLERRTDTRRLAHFSLGSSVIIPWFLSLHSLGNFSMSDLPNKNYSPFSRTHQGGWNTFKHCVLCVH